MHLADIEALVLAGGFNSGLQSLHQILSEEPLNAAALHLRGLAEVAAGEINQGLASLQSAIDLTPHPNWLADLGNVWFAIGLPGRAVDLFERALAAHPNDSGVRRMLGLALTQCGRNREAIPILEAGGELDSDADALFALAMALTSEGDASLALPRILRAAVLAPASVEIGRQAGAIALLLNRFDLASEQYQRILQAHPDSLDTMLGLAAALWCGGRMDECLAISTRARDLAPQNEAAHLTWARALDHVTFNPAASRQAWEHWAALIRPAQLPGAPLCSEHHSSPRPLRVGYLVDEIYSPPNSYFVPSLIAGHDPRSFAVFAYLTSLSSADWTPAEHLGYTLRDARSLAPDDVARMVRNDAIDILVDFSWELRHVHLAVFARRAAPLQVELPLYPATTGHPETDFIFTDPWICPPGRESMYSEPARRLVYSYVPWTPPPDAPPVTMLPAYSNGYCTFGLFQKPAKLNMEVWAVVTTILRSVPSARLLVHNSSDELDDEASAGRRRILANLADVDPGRVSFAGNCSQTAHLTTVAQCDIALDSFPYNGHTTTGDCLWMGVPVITLAGQTHAGRVSFSILSRLGLSELAGETPAQYVELALRLAADIPRLSLLRETLRSRMAASTVTDARIIASCLEAEYRLMWSEVCGKTTITKDATP